MRHAGLTLLETLLAISLLSGLSVVAVAWTTSMTREGLSTQERTRWNSAAAAVLRLIGDDIACGDLDARAPDRDGHPGWVQLGKNELRIQTRAASFRGDRAIAYVFDPALRTLTRHIERGGEVVELRLALGEVLSFSAELRESAPGTDDPYTLSVSITGDDATTRTSQYELSMWKRP